MHISEGIIPIAQAAGWASLAAPFVLDGARVLKQRLTSESVHERAFLGLSSALLFSVTLFPIPVPIAGACSHMCATPLLALILGPRLLVIPTLLTLLVQALFFAHGGLTTLGVNVVTLGVVGPWVTLFLFSLLRSVRISQLLSVGIACAGADLLIYVFDAFVLGMAFAGEKPFESWFLTVIAGFAPVQIPIALTEGLLSAYIVKQLCMKAPHIVPNRLQSFARASGASSLASAGLSLVALLGFANQAHAFSGVDEVVFEKTAESAGYLAKPSSPIAFEGDAELFLYAFAFFATGFLASRLWYKTLSPGFSSESGPREDSGREPV